LVYAHNADVPQHSAARALHDAVTESRVSACITYQNLLEFFAIVTNPRRVARPLSAAWARKVLERYLAHPSFRLIRPTEETGAWLLRLLAKVPVKGAGVFDLFLAATMLTHDITAIATFNAEDFSRIPGVEVFDPASR
jgi:toxin-antitoxin system PIN domain toxin